MAAPSFLIECKSTNDQIEHFVDSAAVPFTALYTLRQTAGKGQYGNSWENATDLNLALSVAIPATYFSGLKSFVNFRTAALLVNFIAKLTNADVQIKWPNDIIIKNKKVAGLLTERKKIANGDFLVIGIGLNILQQNFEGLPKAGSILTQTGAALDPHEVALDLSLDLELNLKEPFSPTLLIYKINRRLFRKDMVSVFLLNGLRQNGIIRNIDEAGLLWVELEQGGLRKFSDKEIELLY